MSLITRSRGSAWLARERAKSRLLGESGPRKCTVRIPAPTGLTPNCIRVLVERDSASGPGSQVQNSQLNRPGASLKELETVESPLEPGMAAVLYLFELR